MSLRMIDHTGMPLPFVLLTNENYGQDAVIIRTERERIVLLENLTATGRFIERFKTFSEVVS